jgi:hypothetical protein
MFNKLILYLFTETLSSAAAFASTPLADGMGKPSLFPGPQYPPAKPQDLNEDTFIDSAEEGPPPPLSPYKTVVRSAVQPITLDLVQV